MLPRESSSGERCSRAGFVLLLLAPSAAAPPALMMLSAGASPMTARPSPPRLPARQTSTRTPGLPRETGTTGRRSMISWEDTAPSSRSASRTASGSTRRVTVEWRYGYDANAVLLKNLTKIESCVLLYHRLEQTEGAKWRRKKSIPEGRQTENMDMTEPDSKGRWWTPRGQNPWAWAFGTP